MSTATAALDAVAAACETRDPAPGDAVDGVAPGVVARPTSTEQVAEVMRASAAHELTVVPRGAGTKLTWGTPPRSADVLLDLTGLDEIVEHAAGDLIVTAQAGVRLDALQQHVAAAGQRLVVDEVVHGSTLGGALATNAGGPRRLVAGTMRDLLIGVTLVRADGVVAKAGGKVVKNVAGYDVGKLLVGSYGTLAVVTSCTFRLHPEPAARRWLTAEVSGPEEAHRLVQAVIHARAVPAGVDVAVAADGSTALTVLLEGRPDGVAGRADAVQQLLPGAVAADVPPDGWGSLPWDPSATGDDRAIALKLTHRISGLAEVLAAADGLALRGSAGAGVVYAALPPSTDPAEARAVVERLRSVCQRQAGSLVVLDAPAAVKNAVDVWGPIPALGLMRRVKDEFDPDHRLSPGRFVGGI